MKSLGSPGVGGGLEQLVGAVRTGLLLGHVCWALSRPLLWAGCEGVPCFPCFFSLPQDNREALGFVLGLLSAFVALTARIPALLRAVSVCWAWLPLCPPVPGRVPQP